ncbi:ribosomal protein S18-alanine N-acetyltransferase [Craterilacuibacter sp.]|uniref:ribosomal protein S18-alanine N-acetyltransferase n=1 Tax=Craterilacuibacter sp. TaxID=2870909 RepID=UPI003F3CD500
MPRLAILEAAASPHPWSERDYSDSLQAGHSFTLLCQEDDILAWSVCMSILDEVHLLNIATSLPHQGRGHARHLLQQIMDTARQQGARNMLLEVRASNQAAQGLYLSEGFCQNGLRKNYYRLSGGTEHAILMEALL